MSEVTEWWEPISPLIRDFFHNFRNHGYEVNPSSEFDVQFLLSALARHGKITLPTEVPWGSPATGSSSLSHPGTIEVVDTRSLNISSQNPSSMSDDMETFSSPSLEGRHVHRIRRQVITMEDVLIGTAPDSDAKAIATPDQKKEWYVKVRERLSLGGDLAFLFPVGAGLVPGALVRLGSFPGVEDIICKKEPRTAFFSRCIWSCSLLDLYS